MTIESVARAKFAEVSRWSVYRIVVLRVQRNCKKVRQAMPGSSGFKLASGLCQECPVESKLNR